MLRVVMFQPAPFAIPPAATGERRRDRRIQVLLAVEIDAERQREAGRLTELSRTGARVQVPGIFPVDEPVTLRRGSVELSGRVVWRRGNAAGIELAEALDERSFLQVRRGQAEQA